MNKQRPINQDLMAFKFPITAITSITHRVSGVVLFLALPFVFYAFELSLDTVDSFESLKIYFATPMGKILVWLVLCALSFHFLAGIRHLLMDIHIGESLEGATLSSKLLIIISVGVFALMGLWLW